MHFSKSRARSAKQRDGELSTEVFAEFLGKAPARSSSTAGQLGSFHFEAQGLQQGMTRIASASGRNPAADE